VQRELAEEAAKKGRARGIPMAVRWAATMAAVVAITMSVTATILYKQQYAAMMAQVKDYGGSLAKFTATQMAVPLLSEDYAAMDVFLQEAIGRQQNFSYMNVVDYDGVVRASTVAPDVNQKYAAPQATPVSSTDPQVAVQSYKTADGRQLLDFSSPVLFQKKTIGAVHLGIYEAPLTAVANLVLVLLAILTVVTIAAVAGGTYLLAQRLAMPVRVLKNSLAELANGRLDYRIAETRKDEFGELYAEFDKTAAALERRYEEPAPPTTLSKHLTEGL
jgi:methyl-accepting chemotaxis protein